MASEGQFVVSPDNSGHGVANKRDKRNYLIPVGVKSLDRRVWFKAIALDDIVSKLSQLASNAAHFVVFDACRNLLNAPTRGGKGFLPVDTRRGMLIAFSTDPGETATDEGSRSGPYAAALAAELTKPGQDHLDLFQNVKETVYQTTRAQVPWTRDGMLQRIYLGGEKIKLPVRKPDQPSSLQRAELALWNAVKDSQDPVALQRYLAQHQRGAFSGLARVLIDRSTEIKKSREQALAKQRVLRAAQQAELQAEKQRRDAQIRMVRAKHIEALRKVRRDAENAKKAIEQSKKQRLTAMKATEEANAAKKKTEQDTQNASRLQMAALSRERPALAVKTPNANQSTQVSEDGNPLDFTKRAQAELKRHRCLTGPIDGLWGKGSQRSMTMFNRYAKLNLPTRAPTQEGLAVLERTKAPACPSTVAKPANKANLKASKRKHSDRNTVRRTANGKCRRETRRECTRVRCRGGGFKCNRDIICAVSELRLICR